MATISYISQLLCLFVGRGDNGAVFLNAQVVSPFVFSHSPPLPQLSTRSLTSRSPLPSPPPGVSPVLPQLHSVSLISPPIFYLFFPLYLAISLTSCPLLSHLFSPSPGSQTAERLSTKASYSSPQRCTLRNPQQAMPPPHTAQKAHTQTHKLGLVQQSKNWHTHAPDKQVNNLLLPENSVWILN